MANQQLIFRQRGQWAFSKAMTYITATFFIVSALSLLNVGCGQKGNLVLPDVSPSLEKLADDTIVIEKKKSQQE